MNTQPSYMNMQPYEHSAFLCEGKNIEKFLIFPTTRLQEESKIATHNQAAWNLVLQTSYFVYQPPRMTTMKLGTTTNSYYSSKLLILLLLQLLLLQTLPFQLVNFFPSDILFKKCTTWYTKKRKNLKLHELILFSEDSFPFLNNTGQC